MKKIITSYDCATPAQYDVWAEAARLHPPALSSWFCADCTIKYQIKMILAGKCVNPKFNDFEKDES